jgi:2-methylcitrate dehydratase PrpD
MRFQGASGRTSSLRKFTNTRKRGDGCLLDRDPRNPRVFSEDAVNDSAIRALCRRVKLELRKETTAENPPASRVTIRLKDGRKLTEVMQHFPGMPEQPLNRTALREKFETITAALQQNRPAQIFDSIATLDRVVNIGELSWSI